jgi:peptidoglycan/LPS O-acetylase OafA/YrhL
MRYRVLDSWRGVCALVVAAFHMPFATALSNSPLLEHAYLYVDFFFVLSGFILAHTYGGRLGSRADITEFVIKRLGRLWPLHLFALALLLLMETAKAVVAPGIGEVAPFTIDHELDELWGSIFLLHGLGFTDGLHWNLPSWSISVEFAVYLIFAALVVACRGRISPGAAALVAVGLGVLAVRVGHMDATFDYGLARGLAGFFVGVLVHRHLLDRRLAAGWATPAELAVVAAVLLLTAQPEGPVQFAAPFVFGIALWVFSQEAGLLSRLLATTPFQRLGCWSYSIYLMHYPMIVGLGSAVILIERITGRVLTPGEGIWLGSQAATTAGLFVALAGVVLVSSFTYRYVETPGRRLVNSWIGPRRPLASAAPA